MDKTFEITVLKRGSEPLVLGTMPEEAITFNRYNEGLLIAAGKLSRNSLQTDAFMKFETLFRNKALMQFQGEEKTYFGEFCFINFIPETHTVVFGSVGPVIEVDTVSDSEENEEMTAKIIAEAPHHVAPSGTKAKGTVTPNLSD